MPPTKTERETAPLDPYASWGRRLGAFIIDQIVVVVLLLADALVFAGVSATGLAVIAVLAAILGGILAFPGYYTYFHGKDGRTLGKRAFGIYVGKATTAGRIGYPEAFGRWAAQFLLMWFLSAIIFIPWLLNYLWPLWDKQHQCWHDKMASTSVYRG